MNDIVPMALLVVLAFIGVKIVRAASVVRKTDEAIAARERGIGGSEREDGAT